MLGSTSTAVLDIRRKFPRCACKSLTWSSQQDPPGCRGGRCCQGLRCQYLEFLRGPDRGEFCLITFPPPGHSKGGAADPMPSEARRGSLRHLCRFLETQDARATLLRRCLSTMAFPGVVLRRGMRRGRGDATSAQWRMLPGSVPQSLGGQPALSKTFGLCCLRPRRVDTPWVSADGTSTCGMRLPCAPIDGQAFSPAVENQAGRFGF